MTPNNDLQNGQLVWGSSPSLAFLLTNSWTVQAVHQDLVIQLWKPLQVKPGAM